MTPYRYLTSLFLTSYVSRKYLRISQLKNKGSCRTWAKERVMWNNFSFILTFSYTKEELFLLNENVPCFNWNRWTNRKTRFGGILYNANKFKYLLLSFKTIIKKYVSIIIKKENRMWPISWFIFPFKTWDTEYNCFWIFSFDANWRT